MRVFITGGTGFVGGEIIARLLAAGHEVRALVRSHRPAGAGGWPDQVEPAVGDILDPELARHLAGMEAVIHLVGIIRPDPSQGVTFQRLHREATLNLLRAMRSAGVSRLVHMSALGAGPGSTTDYFRTKFEAETAVRNSGRAWTVMKPSVIFGPRDRFVNLLAGQVRKLPVVPVIGDGRYRLQPVSATNVAQGFVQALDRKDAEGRVFEIGGPDQLSYNDLLQEIARAVGKSKLRLVHFPLGPMQAMIRWLENFSFFPITSDQLAMLLMNNVCDPAPFFSFFQIDPITFGPGIREYLN